ncbi:similar to Saccharomyces cerevisiae YKR063C LAS1 Essential nuclear protein possibly involved in bud formation and morphogenesis [Maudiozyma saulgeensis]|uniref:Similar to Saccharomyces cerevisiae YKR063C LAS1 Essential nuclear protein possibly involved in bud formation and morphogenesis n=1 Tax=Maudiozyma saulgeensis TaxID=1789683 RepID=A0A1X7R103_9SACH|nr:similar to Saccharomyces cerevisiae YKR063C LAS1 Essential nuclear protein possibly involved in bud formation and morphogenesis [Kazachstania saulgeensis]
MYHVRVVPWADPKELDDLRNWFYSNNDDRAKAIAKVKSYQSRGSQYLPHVIDSTSQLTSAVLLDETNNQVGMNAIRMAYTMALIRFVNGILDPNQQAQYAIPLHRLAQNVGLGSSFVELRHWGTHERDLPSIEMLRITTKEALTWLWDHYWNDSTLEDMTSDDEGNAIEDTVSEEQTELQRVLILWPGLLYEFSHNKYIWQNDNNSLISSSNFTVSEKTKNSQKLPETKINNYINDWKTIWKSYHDREQFVDIVMEKYNSLLLHLLILKLTDFEIFYFKWLLKEYIQQLQDGNKRDSIRNNSLLSKHFRSWTDIEQKLVKRVINHLNIKTVIPRWKLWNDSLKENPSYLSLVIVKALIKRMNEMTNGNGNTNDWRKKKKRRQASNEQETMNSANELLKELESRYDISEKDNYEQSFVIVKTKETISNSIEKNHNFSPNDIFNDLANLKKRLKHANSEPSEVKDKIEVKKQKIMLWETPTDWTPKPFGML